MKLSRAVIILFFAVAFQVSFLRLGSLSPILPNLPLVILFISSYWLVAADVIILALAAGVFIDLFSGVNFGASPLALILIFFMNSRLRESVLKEKTFGEFTLSGLITFFFYYAALWILNSLLNLLTGNDFSFGLLDARMANEIILDLAVAFAIRFLINFYQSRRYGIFWNPKKFTKISS